MRFIFLIITCLVLLQGCDNTPKYVQLADQLQTEFTKQVYQEEHLPCWMIGGSMMNDIQVMSLGFESYQKVNIDQARKLYVKLTQKFMDKINNNTEIRPYLHTYPFTPDNAKIKLMFSDIQTNKFVSKPYIASVMATRGKVFYDVYEPTNPKGLETIHSETYEEAFKIVNQNP